MKSDTTTKTTRAAKAVILSALVSGGGLVASANAGAESAEPPESGVIVEGRSVADVSIGDSRSSVIQQWGEADSRGGTGRTYTLDSGGSITVYFSSAFSDAVVTSFNLFDTDGFRTTRGVGTADFGLGDTDAIFDAYPEARQSGEIIADGIAFQTFRQFSGGSTDRIFVDDDING